MVGKTLQTQQRYREESRSLTPAFQRRTAMEGQTGRSALVCVLFFWLLAACCWPLATAHARIVGIHDWDAGSEGWQGDAWLTIDQTGGFLEFELPGGVNPPDPEWDALVWTADPSTLFAGTWMPDMSVSFDFWASNQVPSQVAVWWGSTNARLWNATVFDSIDDDMSLETWTTLRSPSFNSPDAWGGAGTIDDLTSDLQSIDWIGVYVLRGGGGGSAETYGIDNFALLIPEPPEVLILAMALTLGLVFYRRRRMAPAGS